jgi:uncharacterized protein (TIGR03083 family)
MAIFDDLEAEEDRLDGILADLAAAQWAAPSGAAGWTVCDVVLHLAQSEEAVLASTAGTRWDARPASWGGVAGSGPAQTTLDQVMDQLVHAERNDPELVFQRWPDARRGALRALRAADPAQPLFWVEIRGLTRAPVTSGARRVSGGVMDEERILSWRASHWTRPRR